MSTPVLPGWVPRNELSRPSAEALERAENRKQTLTYAGPNAVIPVVYGEQVVAGPVIAGPVVNGSTFIYAIALCWAGSEGVERIEDVRLGETIANLAAIAVPNTGATASVSGVSVQVYDGRQTTHNAQLAAAIPGFTDAFQGIAYARVSFSTGANFGSMPDLTFRVKGRKVRTGSGAGRAWSENPVLHMRDFVEDAEIGMGAQLIGWEAATVVANSLYSGIPRSRTGLAIQDPMTQEDALALFAQYAEVLWSYDGRDVSIIPDAPVDTIHPINAGDMREGSLQLSTVGLEQIPTQVRIQFSDRSDPLWPSRPAVAEVPEHTMHGMPVAPSSVPLPGVFNRLEAERRAYQRLMRLQVPGRVEWQMFAPGMPYQAGDVVRLPNRRGLQNIDVRLTAQPELVGPLLYQMGGEIYRASDYPSGAAGVAVPTGAILILRGTGAVPDGWSLMSMGDRLVREGAPGNQGSAITMSISGQTNIAGEHSGTRSAPAWAPSIEAVPPDPPPMGGRRIYFSSAGGTGIGGGHRHGVSGSLNAVSSLRRRTVRFVKRTGAAALLPRGMSVLAAGNISNEHLAETPLTGYLSAGTTDALIAGVTSVSGSASAGDHVHQPQQYDYIRMNPANLIENTFPASAAGAHTHSYTVNFTARLRSMALAMFESLGDAAIPEGGIVGWDGATAPSGWAFCDGSNGTIDLSSRFIYLTSANLAGVEHLPTSSWTASIGALSVAGAHSHGSQWTGRPNAMHMRSHFHNDTAGGHSHSVENTSGGSGSLDNILRYQLRFIQYLG